METAENSAPEITQSPDAASSHVRLLADYVGYDNVTVVYLGEICEVLGYHGDDWVYVSRSAEYDHQTLYVPASYVQRFDASSWTYLPSNATSSPPLTRSSTFSSSSRVTIDLSSSGKTRSSSLRENTSPEMSTTLSEDFPDPPALPSGISSPGDSATATKPSSPAAAATRRGGAGVRDSKDFSDRCEVVPNRNASDSRGSQHGQDMQEQIETSSSSSSSIYANWAELQKLANTQNDHRDSSSSSSAAAAKLSPTTLADDIAADSKLRAPVRSSATLPRTSPASTSPATSPDIRRHSHRSSSGHRHQHEEPNHLQPDADKKTLKNKLGYLNCLHATENGKPVVPSQWISMFVALRGALLSLYENEATAQTRADGSMSLPMKSLGLQGALVQVTRYDYPAYDVIKVITLFNTMYILHAETAQETQSWCRYLKHNIAVLLAGRKAIMESATTVAIQSTPSTKLRDKLETRSESTSAVSRVAQRLKELLVRRPTKEDLQSRGIYKDPLFGSTLSAVCAKDKASVPIFLKNCFEQIELRGLTLVGIYRLSGSISKVQKLRIRANQGDYDVSDIDDIHTLTSIVRVFLRELAEPVIPFEFFERFCDCYKKNSQSTRQEAFARLIQELPRENRLTLQELFRHLEKVIENHAENHMTSRNLAIVFGPTLMWLPVQQDRNYATTVMLQGQIVEYLIQEHRIVFGSVPA